MTIPITHHRAWGIRKTFGLALLACAMLSPAFSFAQQSSSSSSIVQVTDDEGAAKNTPVIDGPDDTPVGRTIILDASRSRVVGSDAQYLWFLNDGREPISRTVSAVFTADKDGVFVFRLVIRSRVSGELVEASQTHTVTVFRRKLLLVADQSVPSDTISFYQKPASDAGVYLKVLRTKQSVATRAGDDELRGLFREHVDDLRTASVTILWTDGVAGLQALMDASRADPASTVTFENRAIVVITDASLPTLARTARGPLFVLKPDRIVLMRPESLSLLLASSDVKTFIDQSQKRSVDIRVVDKDTVQTRPWNLLSSLVSYMLVQGVPSQTVILLLMLPVIATILAFLKQVVGMTTFGLFAPSIIALSFVALGWWIGTLFLLFIVFTGYATRALMKGWHLLYIPKMAIILTVGSVTLLLLLGIGASFNIVFSRDTVFILLIMSTLSESFLTAKTEGGWMSAVSAIGQTVLAALICVLVISWGSFQSLILAYPELILLTVVVNILLGRFTGLRITEYFRFRAVFQHLGTEE